MLVDTMIDQQNLQDYEEEIKQKEKSQPTIKGFLKTRANMAKARIDKRREVINKRVESAKNIIKNVKDVAKETIQDVKEIRRQGQANDNVKLSKIGGD